MILIVLIIDLVLKPFWPSGLECNPYCSRCFSNEAEFHTFGWSGDCLFLKKLLREGICSIKNHFLAPLSTAQSFRTVGYWHCIRVCLCWSLSSAVEWQVSGQQPHRRVCHSQISLNPLPLDYFMHSHTLHNFQTFVPPCLRNILVRLVSLSLFPLLVFFF